MAIFDTILRRLLDQLIFRPRTIPPVANEASGDSAAAGDRRSGRLYGAEANHWGLEPEKPSTRSYLEPAGEDGGPAEDAAAPASPRGRRFGLRAVSVLPAAPGLLACGGVDSRRRWFDRRRGR